MSRTAPTLAACLVALAACSAPARSPSRALALGYAPGFINPALRVTVHGVSAWLLVDTGAGVHTFAAWYVKAAGLPVSAAPGWSVRDSSGREVRIRQVRDLSAALADGGTVKIPRAIVAAGSASLLLDTGAEETVISPESAAARRLPGLAPGGVATGVSGAPERRLRSSAVEVDFGAGARSIPVAVGHVGASCGSDGILGLDAVRGCAFVLSNRAVAVACSRG